MDYKDQLLYTKILKFLCVGGKVEGVRFGAVPQILITCSDNNNTIIKGQIYLNLGSNWCVYDEVPDSLPESEEEVMKMTQEEELKEIIKLRFRTIRNVSVTKEAHLIIEFDNSQLFFLYGFNERYEMWQLGVTFNGERQLWEVIAMPGGEITAIIPQSYTHIF